MIEGSQQAPLTPDSNLVNACVWHPWLSVNRIIRDVLTTRWDAAQWPVAQLILKRTLTERPKLARDGWWN